MSDVVYYFFFQAEDGIRDLTVTGVQTCALPIYLFQKLHSLSRDIAKNACNVSAGMSEALHEPLTDWIGEHVEKQDGDFRRCCLCGTDGLILERHNHVHLLADEIPARSLERHFHLAGYESPSADFCSLHTPAPSSLLAIHARPAERGRDLREIARSATPSPAAALLRRAARRERQHVSS